MSEMLDIAAKALANDMGFIDWDKLSDDPFAVSGKPAFRRHVRAVIMAMKTPSESAITIAKERWKRPPVDGHFGMITHGYNKMLAAILKDILND